MKSDDLAQFLLDLVVHWAPWIAMAVARPFAFAITFAPFAWGNIASGMMRMAFAFVIAMPGLYSGSDGWHVEELALPISLTLAKEMIIGALLGFFASIPYAIANMGGNVIDVFRGGSNGNSDPTGGQISQYSQLFVIMTLWLFANLAGFWVVARLINSSYAIWPVQSVMPAFSFGANSAILALQTIAIGAMIISAPMVIIMFASDFIHLASTKFGKQINITHLSFSSKNTIAILVLPYMSFYLIRVFKGDFFLIQDSANYLRMLFQ